MNKDFIVDFLFKKAESEDNKELLEYIEEAKIEMEVANHIFNNVCEPKLIEAAIYAEESAKKKYEYLLALVKSNRESK